MSAVLKFPQTYPSAPETNPIFAPLPENATIVLRPSDIVSMSACGYQHALKRAGVLAEAVSATLVFGTCMHTCVQMYVTKQVKGSSLRKFFEQLWQETRRKQIIRYSSTDSFEKLLATGSKLAEIFPDWWKASGFRPWRMPNGEYAVEKRLTAQLAPNVILSTQPDLIVEVTRTLKNDKGYVMAVPGTPAILDAKTPRASSTIQFAQRAIQLTFGKIAAEANRSLLGLSKDIGGVGYVEALKRKEPRFEAPFLYERPVHLVQDAVRLAISVADRIRRGDFARCTGLAFNSPCNMCEYENACLTGSDEGLVLPEGITADQLLR